MNGQKVHLSTEYKLLIQRSGFRGVSNLLGSLEHQGLPSLRRGSAYLEFEEGRRLRFQIEQY
jgi:hypothetical protein